MDRTQELWDLLKDAQRAVHTPGQRRGNAPDVLAYRNGVMDAYAAVTGEDSEAVYERLQDTLQAEHEARESDQ